LGSIIAQREETLTKLKADTKITLVDRERAKKTNVALVRQTGEVEVPQVHLTWL
jgi:hypothetical protein